MTWPAHILLSYGGTMCSGKEIWANNIRFTHGDSDLPLDIDNLGSMIDDIKSDINDLFQDTRSKMLTDTKVTWIKFNPIGPDGRYVDKEQTIERRLTADQVIQGSVQGPILPPQCTVAITLKTGVERGRASRGRIFVPRPAVECSLDGTFSVQNANDMAAMYGEFFGNLGDWPGLDLTTLAPSVVSGLGDGTKHKITHVEVGRVVDTQRRRRNALTEPRVNHDLSG